MRNSPSSNSARRGACPALLQLPLLKLFIGDALFQVCFVLTLLINQALLPSSVLSLGC